MQILGDGNFKLQWVGMDMTNSLGARVDGRTDG